MFVSSPLALLFLSATRRGLVHISQVANSFVQDINDHVKVGDMVKVKVLSIDEESHKIALSIREALPKEERRPKSNKPFNKQPRRQSEASANPAQEYFRPQSSVNASSDFEDKMKEWMKQANDRQTSLNRESKQTLLLISAAYLISLP